MGFIEWLKELFGVKHDGPAARPRAPRAQRRATYLPTPRRKTPRRKRYKRPEAAYNPDHLSRYELPLIATTHDLARELRLSEGKLRWLTWPRTGADDDHYIRWSVPKSSGGTRQIAAPKTHTRQAQDWVLKEILKKVPVSAAAHGFIKRRSIVTNAQSHTGKDIVINMDLEDFFPSVSMATVVGLFEWMGYSKDVAWHLGMLCTCRYARRRALPQGAPTSPAISNLICWKLDRRLAGLARCFEVDYTRYADDMTFSGNGAFARCFPRLIARVKRICDEEGFTVHPAKTRVMRKSRRQTVTGLVVNDKASISRKEVRRLRAILHNCRTKGASTQNRDDDPMFRERLLGKIALVRMVDPEKARALMDQFEQVAWYDS